MSSHYKLTDLPTVVKSKRDKRWYEADLSGVKIKDLFALYKTIEVPVLDFFDQPKTLDLYKYETELANYEESLEYWFNLIGNRGLELTDEFPKLEIVKSNYLPIEYHPCTIKPAKAGYHPSHEVSLDDCDDIILTVSDVDPMHLHKRALFTVNGFVFPTKYQDYGVRIVGAGDCVRHSKGMEGGIINFEHIGEITQVPIDKNMVNKVDDSKTWFDKLIIRTKENLMNKTVGIVIGGYLHLLDGTLEVISDEAVTVSLRNLDLLGRAKESKDKLHLEFLNLEDLSEGESVREFYNEANALDYLTSRYSFLVLIDNPEMMLDTYSVSSTAMMGTYTLGKDQELGLLRRDSGGIVNYWPHYECGIWALKTTYWEQPTQLDTSNGWEKLTLINDAKEPYTPDVKPLVNMINWSARK